MPDAALRQIETLSQLEKLTVSNINFDVPPVFHIKKLTALRELELSNWCDKTDRPMLIVDGYEDIQNFTRLERLTFSAANLGNSDIKFLCKLPTLRELDLTGCPKIDDKAVPYLQKMTGLRRLTLENTGITDEGAERIDDALPNCRVIYGAAQ